jgi:predicted DNA-binding transcriptional regulator AlpA
MALKFSDLMDTTAVSELTGLKRGTISTYLYEGSFPEPLGRLGGSPVWKRKQIEQWLRSRPGQGKGGGWKKGRPRNRPTAPDPELVN